MLESDDPELLPVPLCPPVDPVPVVWDPLEEAALLLIELPPETAVFETVPLPELAVPPEVPDPDVPDPDVPDPEVPDPDVPDPDVPDPDVPDPDVPDPDVPEPDVPEPDVPDPDPLVPDPLTGATESLPLTIPPSELPTESEDLTLIPYAAKSSTAASPQNFASK